MLSTMISRLRSGSGSLKNSQNGNVLMILALGLPVLLGIAGLAIEGADWYATRRDMQNAADAAVLAAAANGSSN